ncbi:MAG: hypothetical protein K5790_00420 [Nitrosopumilus sp.]|uniref:hypothetical protein n=1 Tax=Nitrosopumilus sp. TaxID=2024843 RepID=UPI00247C8ED7|nr:hypothetical protein [Nitrosopumilus sp.]MCV0391740.1 hypothetical protein [Nitrosopumilus sp.]
MTCKNTTNIALLSIVAVLAISPFVFSNVLAEESEGYKMIGDISPVLTFTFREGVEIYEFPVFEMGENFAQNSGTSFSVEGTVTKSPLLHKAMDEAYKYRLSNAAYDHQFKYFDVDANFVQGDKSILTLDYNNCRVENYQIETLDSNDYESYFKEVGFAIVDKIDFVCSGVNIANVEKSSLAETMVDYGSSGFNFANDVKPLATFKFDSGIEKIEFPVFNLISGYQESSDNVVTQFQLEGILDYYPLLYNAIDKSRQVSGISSASHIDFDVLVEFANSNSTLRGFNFKDCRISDAKITTQSDKEEGFTGKSGFALVHQLTFTCSGLAPINMNYSKLGGNGPSWKVSQIYNAYTEPIQNTDKGLKTVSTFTFADGIEEIEFSMFTQSDVLTSTVDTGSPDITDKPAAPTLELRGIVGDYPMLYNYVDKIRKVQGVAGTQFKDLADIDVKIISNEEIIRSFNYQNCRPTDYSISTNTNSEESYMKNSFAIESIFDFECQGYHPNNPVYDAMFDVKKANTESSKDLRNTDQWRDGFTVRK